MRTINACQIFIFMRIKMHSMPSLKVGYLSETVIQLVGKLMAKLTLFY